MTVLHNRGIFFDSAAACCHSSHCFRPLEIVLQLNHLIFVVLLCFLSLSDSLLKAFVGLKELLILLYRLLVLVVDLLEALLKYLQFLSMLQIQLVILMLQTCNIICVASTFRLIG